jgi:predicted metal-dependent HD superfamily phosphohydrolase
MTKKDITTSFPSILLYAKETIFSGLPKSLYYHHPEHTFGDVLPHAQELAELEHVDIEGLFLLKVAVVFHDTGFTKVYANNESIGAEIAETALKSFGFLDFQIVTVKNMIMATRISKNHSEHIQSAGESILEQIICDADLDNLGRDDFFQKGEDLRKELTFQGKVVNDNDWYLQQITLLKSHSYYTKSAHSLRDAGKEKNLRKLEMMFEKENFNRKGAKNAKIGE